jgi:hypothetical protein
MRCPAWIDPIETLCSVAVLVLCSCVDEPSRWKLAEPDALRPEAASVAGDQAEVAVANGPFRHDAFAWQRRWTPAVREAVAHPSAELDGLLVLLGEVEWADGPRLVRTEADLTLLAAGERPVGVALRVGMPPDGWGPMVAEATVDAVEDLRVAAAAAGFLPSELHLDIDVPTSRLDSYASWLSRIRAAWPGVPLTITGLPTWLESDSLPTVLDNVDGWVLQVHWLDTYRSRLLVSDRARDAVWQAGALGPPFRVALPTYRSSGRRCEPSVLVDLLEGWNQRRPANMTGVVWFRLPVDGERDTLPRAAFEAVLAGRVPTAVAEVTVVEATEEAAPGTLDVFVTATGEDEVMNPCVELAWDGHSPVALDAVRGEPSSDSGRAWFEVQGLVRPGDEPRPAGWIRLTPGEVVREAIVVDGHSCGHGW